MKKCIINLPTILMVSILSVFIASCGDDENPPSQQPSKSDIIQNLMKYKWTGTSTDYDTYSYGAATYTQTWIVYFTSDHEGVMHCIYVDRDSALGTSKSEEHIDFTYSVDGTKIRLSGGSSYVFDYYGDYMMEGDDLFKPSAMTSSDYTYLQEHKAGYHGTDGPVDADIYVINDSQILKTVFDIGGGWYEYVLQFGFGANGDDAYKKGITEIKLTAWVENGCLEDTYKTSNYGKKKTYTLYLSPTERDWYDGTICVGSKESPIYFNYELEYYNSTDKQWYDIIDKRVAISRPEGDNGGGNGGDNGDDNGGDDNPVDNNSGTYQGHAYVDLGLPSGTLWATMNVGASKPEDYGDYFAWGETTGYKSGKTFFDWNTYKYSDGDASWNAQLTKYCTKFLDGTVDNKTELEPSDDAATVNWGSGWQMPNQSQQAELFNSDYTTVQFTTQNGVKGEIIKSKSNSKSIFLPAAGCRFDDVLSRAGDHIRYWSRSLSTSNPTEAYYVFYGYASLELSDCPRFYGQSVRPVRKQ